MRTKAVRIYGKDDLRLEEFDLPEMKEDEILAEVISDSLCMSSYKATKQGPDHKRVPDDVDKNPTMLGHEFSGRILEVGKKWQDRFKPGDKFSIQPALNYKGSLDAPGYSFRYIGGDATRILIPREVMTMNCLLEYDGDAFYMASLSEPYSCVVAAFRANYHIEYGSYAHHMGIKEGGHTAILAGAGPMGLAAIDYAIHADRKPQTLVVTDIVQERLDRAARLLSTEEAAKNGIKLHYINTSTMKDPHKELMKLTGNKGYDDVFVFAPVQQVVELGDALLGFDGCLNFFAGPSDPGFSASMNFYNVHYGFTHIAGTSGGNTEDMRISLKMMSEGKLNPAVMVTHIGGLDSVIDTTKRLPEIPGGKKLMYTQISMPLTAIEDFREKGRSDPLFKGLADIVEHNNGLWCKEAEDFLLEHGGAI